MTIDEPFEYLTFGGTFGRSFGLLIDRFDLFMAVSVVVMIPFAVLFLTTSIIVAYAFIESGPWDDDTPDFHSTHIPAIVLTYALWILLYDFASVIGQGAITQAVSQIYIGQRPEWLQCIKKAWKRKWSLIGSSLIVYGSLFLALIPPLIFMSFAVYHPNAFTITMAVVLWIAYVAGGLYAYIGLILTSPAIMVEGFTSPIKGVKRSWELSTGSRPYLICTLFCLWFLNQLMTRLLHNMFVSGNIIDIFFSFVGIVVTIVPVFISFPLHAM